MSINSGANSNNNALNNLNVEIKSNGSPSKVALEGSVDLNNINFNISSPNKNQINVQSSPNKEKFDKNNHDKPSGSGPQTTNRVLDDKENDDLNAEPYDKERVIFITRNKRIAVFIWLITINIICNLDDGTIPACTEELKEKLGITEDLVGLLGTLVYCGNLIGNSQLIYY